MPLNQINNDNISPEQKKETFKQWQDKISDRIHRIIENPLNWDSEAMHYFNIMNENTASNESFMQKFDKERNDLYWSIEHNEIENNFLYNIPNIITYLYQNMWTKTNKLITSLAKLYNNKTWNLCLNIDWSKYNSKLPQQFKQYCKTKVLNEKYIQYLLGRAFLQRHDKYRWWKKTKPDTKYTFSELLINSSLFRKWLEWQFETIEHIEEIEYIRFLVDKSLKSMPNLREVSYSWWLKYMWEWVKEKLKELEKNNEKNEKELSFIKEITDKIFIITESIKQYELTWEINKELLEKNKQLIKDWKSKYNNKELEKYILELSERSKKENNFRIEINKLLKELWYDELETILELKIWIQFAMEEVEKINKQKEKEEKELKYIESTFKEELEEKTNQKNYKKPISIKKAIEAEKWKKEFEEMKRLKDFKSLNFSEEQAISQMMSVISKFKKESSDDELRDNIPVNFLKNKNFTCFSWTWLVASLLKEIWFKDRDIFISHWSLGKWKIIYKHAFVILRKSNWDFLKIDYGFWKIENMNPNVLNDFLENDVIWALKKWYNVWWYNLNSWKDWTWLDMAWRIYRLNDWLSIWYLRNLAWEHFESKDYREAKKLLNTGLAIDNRNPDIYELLMLIADKEWDKDQAKKYAKKIWKTTWFYPTWLYILWKYAFEEWDYKDARKKLEQFNKFSSYTRQSDEWMFLDSDKMLKKINEELKTNEISDKEIGEIINEIIKETWSIDTIPDSYVNLQLDDRKKVLASLKSKYDKEKDVKEKLSIMAPLSLILVYENANDTEIGNKIKLSKNFSLTF